MAKFGDFPSFSHRGFMLDTGRKFIPYDTLCRHHAQHGLLQDERLAVAPQR